GPRAALAVVAIAAAGCAHAAPPPSGAAAAYPEPRFPSYLKPVSTVEEVLPHVRPLVRTKSGVQGAGLGVANAGETVAFVTASTPDRVIVDAVRGAREGRGVKVNVVPEYEMVGISRADALEYDRIRRSYTAEQGYMEAATWVEANFPDPDA